MFYLILPCSHRQRDMKHLNYFQSLLVFLKQKILTFSLLILILIRCLYRVLSYSCSHRQTQTDRQADTFYLNYVRPPLKRHESVPLYISFNFNQVSLLCSFLILFPQTDTDRSYLNYFLPPLEQHYSQQLSNSFNFNQVSLYVLVQSCSHRQTQTDRQADI